MLIVFHNNKEVVRVQHNKQPYEGNHAHAAITDVLTHLAKHHPEECLVWCDVTLAHAIQLDAIPDLLRVPHEIISFYPGYGGYFGSAIEWVEESPFVSVSKQNRYATWMVSSIVGAMQASLWSMLANHCDPKNTFAYTLQAIGKQVQLCGVFCYSEPKMLQDSKAYLPVKASFIELYQFVKQFYKSHWVWVLFWQQLRHREGLQLWALLHTFFVRRKKAIPLEIPLLAPKTKQTVSISVLIPTLNRPQFLLNFLTDLHAQTLLPTEVILVEQSHDASSNSQLEAIVAQSWNFKITHLFTTQMGVCHARNLGLAQVTGDWIFFADDDIRIAPDFLENCWHQIRQHNAQAVSVACIAAQQLPSQRQVVQWHAFGGGSSLVSRDALATCRFSKVFEHGFGEDLDFGMQLRQSGTDVLFFSTPAITHLKAPSGGFRTNKKQQWQSDNIQPKPAPTVQAYIQKYYTIRQQKTYKLLLCISFYKYQSIKNPIRYFFRFQKQWKQSVYWATQLASQL